MSTVTHYFSTLKTQSINDLRKFTFPSRKDDPLGGVDRDSAVFATITQLRGAALDEPFGGDASLSVRNIIAHNSGLVELWLAVSPEFFDLDVRIQFLVCND